MTRRIAVLNAIGGLSGTGFKVLLAAIARNLRKPARFAAQPPVGSGDRPGHPRRSSPDRLPLLERRDAFSTSTSANRHRQRISVFHAVRNFDRAAWKKYHSRSIAVDFPPSGILPQKLDQGPVEPWLQKESIRSKALLQDTHRNFAHCGGLVVINVCGGKEVKTAIYRHAPIGMPFEDKRAAPL